MNRRFGLTGGSMVCAAVGAALGAGPGVTQGAAVTSLIIRDVGSNTANGPDNYSSALDGRSGAFRFISTPLNVSTYPSASFFTGDAGTGSLLGEGAANATGSFSTGFLFISTPFVPYTFGSGFSADISNGELFISNLDFGARWGNFYDLHMAPDPGTLEVLWVVPGAVCEYVPGLPPCPVTYDVAFRWAHDITSTEDPSLGLSSFTAQWVLEGSAVLGQTEVPLPPAAGLLGAGLAAFAGAGRRRSKRVESGKSDG